jgi:hypothetical protein
MISDLLDRQRYQRLQLLATGRGTRTRAEYYREIANALRAGGASLQFSAAAAEFSVLAAEFERLAEYAESASTDPHHRGTPVRRPE